MDLLEFKRYLSATIALVLQEADIFGYGDQAKGKGQKKNIWDYPEEKPEIKPATLPQVGKPLTINDLKKGDRVEVTVDVMSSNRVVVIITRGTRGTVHHVIPPDVTVYFPGEDQPIFFIDDSMKLDGDEKEHYKKNGWLVSNLKKVEDSVQPSPKKSGKKLTPQDFKVGDRVRVLQDTQPIWREPGIPAGTELEVVYVGSFWVHLKNTKQNIFHFFDAATGAAIAANRTLDNLEII